MLHDHWPLLALRVTTAAIELHLPTDDQLSDLADLAVEGIHEPGLMPFLVPWTDLPPAERGRSVIQHHWLRRGTWTPDNWALSLCVTLAGTVVGLQTVRAVDFATVRTVHTGSWLGRRYQGQGIGTEMRRAVLHLAFAGLDAAEAKTGALVDNLASARVSAKLGYEPDGTEHALIRGRRATVNRLRLARPAWERQPRPLVSIVGLDLCRPLFGLPSVDG